MKHYRTLYYRAKFGDGHILDNIIAWGTMYEGGEPFSHCEIQTPDENGNFVESKRVPIPCPDNKPGCCTCHYKLVESFVGTCWTSTMRGDHDGTVKRDASMVLTHPERWWYSEHEVSDGQFNRMIRHMEAEVRDNLGYSKWELAKFIPILRHFISPDIWRNICSEFCHNAMCVARTFSTFFAIVSPRKLAKLDPGEIKPLVKIKE